MPRLRYITWNPKRETLDTIQRADTICRAYAAQGFDLTLRQLYYQFVARDWFPPDRTWTERGGKWVRDENGTPNAEPNYKWLGEIINNARLAGLLDWSYVTDRTRELEDLPHWTSPPNAIAAMAHHYRIERWQVQPYRPEVWVEKDALAGVIEPICNRLDVPYLSCRGYMSQSEMWEAGHHRMRRWIDEGQIPIVFHLGDHDPSGIHMSVDIEQRLEMFVGEPVEVRRLALTMAQIQQYQPPPNPAKITDSRAADYIARFGRSSWELDALEPTVLADLIEDAVLSVRDEDLWSEATERQRIEKALLVGTSREWSRIAKTVDAKKYVGLTVDEPDDED